MLNFLQAVGMEIIMLDINISVDCLTGMICVVW
jgi:hypothetical protein